MMALIPRVVAARLAFLPCLWFVLCVGRKGATNEKDDNESHRGLACEVWVSVWKAKRGTSTHLAPPRDRDGRLLF